MGVGACGTYPSPTPTLLADKNYFKRISMQTIVQAIKNTLILVDLNVLVEVQRVLRRGESARSGICIKWIVS